MKISVALATYNGEHFLDAQLRSFEAQTRLPDELVICDDGSSDATLAMLDDFARRAPFPVRLFRNEVNLGSTKNFEKAVMLCEGDAIAFCDQDDVWLPDKLKLSEAALDASPNAGYVFTDATVVDQDLNPLGFNLWEAVLFDAPRQHRLTHGDALDILIERNVVTGATLMFRSQWRSLVVPFSEYWVHDGWVAMLITLFADAAIVPQPTILYRQHDNNQIGIHLPDVKAPEGGIYVTSRARPRQTATRAKPGLLKRLAKSRTRDPFRTRSLARQFGPVFDRLISYDPEQEGKARARMFRDFIVHMETRGSMPYSRLKRLPLVMRELVTRRYERFSPGGILPFGLSNALADMMWDTLVDAEHSVWAKYDALIQRQMRTSLANFLSVGGVEEEEKA